MTDVATEIGREEMIEDDLGHHTAEEETVGAVRAIHAVTEM